MQENTLTPIIQAVNLSKHLTIENHLLIILDQLNLQIEAGESVAITGASGSGKSTLLGLLAGLDVVTTGNITLLGQDLGILDEDQRAALRLGQVGFVFQSFHLMPHLTALENVMLPLELDKQQRDIQQRARQVLEQVGLAQRLQHLPGQLSGGEQQRVALARAFVHQVKVLFADEPTGNLDQKTGEGIIDLLFSLQAHYNTTLVLVTHDEKLAQRCDQHYPLVDGRLQR